jgi:hypothetical protein
MTPCRQLYVLDTYSNAHNRLVNHSLAAFLALVALALTATAAATALRIIGLTARLCSLELAPYLVCHCSMAV